MGYNNKILVSDGKLNLGKNKKVNTFELKVSTPKIIHKNSLPTAIHKSLEQKQTNTQTITHEEEKFP